MKKLTVVLFLSFATLLSAASLHLQKGYIKAHTQVLGDSTIDPATGRVHAALTISGDPATLRGSVWILARDLRSDNKERDQHMYEVLEVKKYPRIRFRIDRVRRQGSGYLIEGRLSLHGKSHTVKVPVKITGKGSELELTARFRILMSDYGIKPPKLLFLTVRDAVDLTVYLRTR